MADLRNELNGLLFELLEMLCQDLPYGTLAAKAESIIESYTAKPGQPRWPHGKSLLRSRKDKEDNKEAAEKMEARKAPAWAWFGDIDHDEEARELYAAFTELDRFVFDAKTSGDKIKRSGSLRGALADYLDHQGYAVPEHIFAGGKQPTRPVSRENPDTTADGDGKNRKRRKRGRQPETDAKKDQKVFEAWSTSQHSTHEALAEAMGMTKRDVKLALDRHRKR